MTACTCTPRLIALTTIVLLVLSGPALSQVAPRDRSAQTMALAPASTGDLHVEALIDADTAPLVPGVSLEPVQFSWPVSGKLTAPDPFTAESRQYWKTVTARELRDGVTVHTHARGALIRISPVTEGTDTDALVAIEPSRLEIRSRDGVHFSAGTAMQQIATAEQLTQAGAPFPELSSAFQLAERVGSGPIVIRATDLPEDSSSQWILHIFEPTSSVVATARVAQDAYIAGQTVTARVALVDTDRPLQSSHIRVSLVSPAGQALPVRTVRDASGAVIATATLPIDASSARGLWEIHATATDTVDGKTVVRDVRTAFAAASRTARLGHVATISRARGVEITLPIDVGAAGRYELRGVMCVQHSGEEAEPVAVAHAASWLGTGTGELTLHFPADLLANVAPGGRLQLRDLRLIDSGRTALLHRQQLALDLGPASD